MNKYFSQLNSTERRLVVIVGVVFFVIINLVWVRPHFGDWGKFQDRMQKARTNLQKYKAEIAKAETLKPNIKKLEGAGDVPEEDQSVHLLRTIQTQASQSSVYITTTPRLQTRTNQFFLELMQPITVQSGEKELVDFLYTLGSGDSMIRVRDLSIRPDPAHQRLDATIRLLASFQKKPNVAPATAPKAAQPTTTIKK